MQKLSNFFRKFFSLIHNTKPEELDSQSGDLTSIVVQSSSSNFNINSLKPAGSSQELLITPKYSENTVYNEVIQNTEIFSTSKIFIPKIECEPNSID